MEKDPEMTDRKDAQMDNVPVNHPQVVSSDEWEQARQEMLKKEKTFTHVRDDLAAQRRRMPWMKVEKDYVFESPDGRVDLADLFDGRRRLILYRAFYEPGVEGWPGKACIGWPRRAGGAERASGRRCDRGSKPAVVAVG